MLRSCGLLLGHRRGWRMLRSWNLVLRWRGWCYRLNVFCVCGHRAPHQVSQSAVMAQNFRRVFLAESPWHRWKGLGSANELLFV